MSSDDEYYDSDDQMSLEDSDEDYGFDTTGDEAAQRKSKYEVMTRADILRRQKEAIEQVTSILGISDDDAARVLRKYKWDANRVNEEWFSDMDAVRAAVGMVDEAPEPTGSSDKCMICFEEHPRSAMRSAACKHGFCTDCWSGYLANAVSCGPTVLDLRCPLPDCKAEVPVALVHEVLQLEPKTAELVPRYDNYALRSFVEDNRAMVWCVGVNCENAVECCVDRAPDEPLDVVCSGCDTTFCFNCKEEAHRPVSCDTVRKWITKNSAESENLNWILANTKPCPKCYRPIEKNQGCMHMTCSQCRHEFCWLCNGTWSEHGERTGGFYACNRYEAAKKTGEYDGEQRRRENAKHSLERYMHYFERWDAHNKARDKARKDAAQFEAESLEQLSDMTKTPTSQLKFIKDAWRQVIECRRILKWTYAYGYYSWPDEEDAAMGQRRQFFEFLQGDAERILDQLHEWAEMKLRTLRDEFAEAGLIPGERFQDFRKHLIGLTDVTHGSFDKLVAQLERGFEDMHKRYAGQPAEDEAGSSAAAAAAAAANGAGSSRAAAVRGGGRGGKRARTRAAAAAGGGAAGADGVDDDEVDPVTGNLVREQGFWKCNHCTVNNLDLAADTCEVCGLPRPE
ncbi:hypothetical protein OEZ85_007696 [Tetradesmus obliquus]|uniref:IBR domain-containing protein n=1 Tax=Tetradesmus obliquus TaxID=3088 RepID=A0ABY8TIH7_TETOB|nr:hypothetical protein OEZ85_007696 [Tetradesmus obliquus]